MCPHPVRLLANDYIPEGLAEIARRFNAGFATLNGKSPGGTAERPGVRQTLFVEENQPPLRDLRYFLSFPGVKNAGLFPVVPIGTSSFFIRDTTWVEWTPQIGFNLF
jgi:hypothetical protein